MNKYTLRLTWVAVKAAECLLPVLWWMFRLALFLFILAFVLTVLVIIL